MLWNIFCALVLPSTLKYHRQQGKRCCFFFHHNYDYSILSYTIIRIYAILHIYLQVSETEELVEMH